MRKTVTAAEFFAARLSHETDPSDVEQALKEPGTSVIVVDPRGTTAFKDGRVPGAISLPYREIDAASTSGFDRDAEYVTYGWGPGCNAGTKAAVKLAELGFRTKEMIGGLEYWRKEGNHIEDGN